MKCIKRDNQSGNMCAGLPAAVACTSQVLVVARELFGSDCLLVPLLLPLSLRLLTVLYHLASVACKQIWWVIAGN